jgi:hypothetical protein
MTTPSASAARDPRQDPAFGAPVPLHDPVRFCVFTTVALIAWAAGPPFAVTLMAGLGLWAYGRAIRAGLTRSRCVLRRPWLVVAYLLAAFAAGAVFLVRGLL